ncbi:MAG: hypothetical protein OXN89_10370 [Bryobacterales bacterium]|nr:hypothetical protein [Bryobacterales bacterium]
MPADQGHPALAAHSDPSPALAAELADSEAIVGAYQAVEVRLFLGSHGSHLNLAQ